MTDSPEHEPEFYINQIKLMKERYSVFFKKWGIKWQNYIDDVEYRLSDKKYWIWCFLVGFEAFIKKDSNKKRVSKALEFDKEDRIKRIIGDFYKVQEYVRNL